MAFETAFLDFHAGGQRIIFPNGFLHGGEIPINGLVWMGDRDFMLNQINQKIDEGFSCIKMKIGALDIETELSLLKYVRDHFSSHDIILRVDANGAFNPDNVMDVLKRLERLKIHSIEQPIQAGQWEAMYELCRRTPVPIGLDEELIGEFDRDEKVRLVDSIRPHYLILKPSLLGGFRATSEWITIARSRNIGWWITSALESNIGLNAICQFTYDQGVIAEQGLGTGQLFTNNVDSPLELYRNSIRYNNRKGWDLSGLGVQGM
jgi:L-alanine-DL-glutamate epimerase-like enolase superfamily enzyme